MQQKPVGPEKKNLKVVRYANQQIHELKKQQKTLLHVHPPSKPDPCAPTTEELKTEDQQDAAGSMVVTVLAALSRILALFLSFPSILPYRYPSSLF